MWQILNLLKSDSCRFQVTYTVVNFLSNSNKTSIKFVLNLQQCCTIEVRNIPGLQYSSSTLPVIFLYSSCVDIRHRYQVSSIKYQVSSIKYQDTRTPSKRTTNIEHRATRNEQRETSPEYPAPMFIGIYASLRHRVSSPLKIRSMRGFLNTSSIKYQVSSIKYQDTRH
jgi:hypothetical protein